MTRFETIIISHCKVNFCHNLSCNTNLSQHEFLLCNIKFNIREARKRFNKEEVEAEEVNTGGACEMNKIMCHMLSVN